MSLRTLSLVLLLAPAPALAVDLTDLVVGWTNTIEGQNGSDGVDEARDVLVTAANEVIVVGYLDGAANHGKDAYAINYETDGTSNWEIVHDTGDASTSDIPGSNDRFNSLAIDAGFNTMALCGTRGQVDTTADPRIEDWYWVGWYEELVPNKKNPPLLDREVYARDGSPDVSPFQACTGVAYNDGIISGSGWSTHSSFAGRWYNRYYQEANGNLVGATTYSDDNVEEPSVPDRAMSIARNDDGIVAVVGTRGASGADGSIQNNTDWHVRVFDGIVPDWEHTIDGAENLEDIAYGVAVDPTGVSSLMVVVGSTNLGADNVGNSDRDWLIVAYRIQGDGDGGPDIQWIARYGTDSDRDEVATSVTFDENGDIIVAGSDTDPTTGNEIWRVAKYSPLDGTLVGAGTQAWNGPDWGGDSRINSVDVRDGRVFMAGYIDDGTGRDFATAMLEIDSDLDGVSDSVDICNFDPNKSDPGVCGCNSPDDDFDNDGVENCIDECPTDPAKTDRGVCPCEAPDIDSDNDGALDCLDECPADPDKIRVGECGCGAPDDDDDGDGLLNCYDGCLETPKGATIDAFGCSDIVDTGDPNTDGGPSDGGGGGGCHTTGGLAPFGALLPLFLLLARRTRRD